MAIILTFLMILPLLGLVGDLLAANIWALLNLYNFVDGIDGIAGIEAVTVCLDGAVLYGLAAGGSQWMVPVLLLAAVAVLVAVGWLGGVLGVVMAYAPLVWLAVRFKAGARELQGV